MELAVVEKTHEEVYMENHHLLLENQETFEAQATVVVKDEAQSTIFKDEEGLS